MSEGEEEIRRKVRAFPGKIAGDVFEDEVFQGKMNAWMIRTHISWGISLAITFVGINDFLQWMQQVYGFTFFDYWVVLIPVGTLYLLWQYLRYPRKKPQSENA